MDRTWALSAVLVAIAAMMSALLTALGIRYAHRNRLIDLPGQRRSHRVPTPRGGGIGIGVAVITCALMAGYFPLVQPMPVRQAWALVLAVGLVGLVGWIDDHRSLAARWRITAHGVAAAVLVGSGHAGPLPYPASALPTAWPLVQLLTVAGIWIAIVWSINLHNFMDGIDGILATQAIFVLVALAVLLDVGSTSPAATCWSLVFAAAAAGFLPFNFPRARIFMGDVGSGVLGLLVALAVLWQATVADLALASGVVLCSAFVTDATCTLLSRFVRQRRWYSAHREHLYQWLVRSGFSHVQVVAFYMGWNLLIVLPAVYWMNRSPETRAAGGFVSASAVYALAIATWWLGKRWCLAGKWTRGPHAAA